MTIWKQVARFAARPAVADWLIRRAMKTPFSHLPSNDDPSYMERYWLFNPYPISSSNRKRWQFPWSIRIHHIKRCDYDRDCHDHPWNARTIILKGEYLETRLLRSNDPIVSKVLDDLPLSGPLGEITGVEYFWRLPGDTATLAFEEYHQINEVSEGGVWTLFITGPWRGVWGFLVDGVKVPWRTYLGEDDKAETAALANDPVVQSVEADALTMGTKIHQDLEKIRINTGMFPELRGIPAFEQKLIINRQFGNMCRVSPDIRTWPDSSMLEIIKDIEALEAIYKRNPQLEAMVGGEFKIRSQDRDDDGLVDPKQFGTPDDHTDDFERLVRGAQEQRHPRTSREWAEQFNPNKEFGKMGWNGKAVDCEKLRIADQRGEKCAYRPVLHPLDSIAEWRKGCSCAPNEPADCNECTTALIEVIEVWFEQHGGPHK